MPEITANDELLRKQTELGIIRELPINKDHMWQRVAPLLEIESDDFTFQYGIPEADQTVPFRSEDAESETMVSDTFAGLGNGSVVDMAVHHMTKPSDITRWKDHQAALEAFAASGAAAPRSFQRWNEQYQSKVAKDRLARFRAIDNTIEWMTTQALSTGTISYDNGNGFKFDVDFQADPAQTDQGPASGTPWDDANGGHDPLGDIDAIQEYMYNAHDITMGTMILSRKALRTMKRSTKWFPRVANLPTPAGVTPTDQMYFPNAIGDEQAAALIAAAVDVESVIVYDAKMRIRPVGSNVDTGTDNRFLPENQVIFLPNAAEARELLGTDIGFMRNLTAPHPEALGDAGFYEFVDGPHVDPWGIKHGTGIKVATVLPAAELMYSMRVF